MNFLIRPYEQADYPQLAEISKTIYSDRMGFSLVIRLKNNRILRSIVAENTGTSTIVGYALVGGQDSMNKKVRLELIVDAQFEQLDISTSLYNGIIQEIAEISPVVVQTRIFEEQTYARSFFEQQGFHENHRMVHVSLSLKSFDPSRFLGIEEQLKHNKIRIITLAEEKLIDPEFLYKLHELDNLTSPEFPRDQFEAFVPLPFEQSLIIHEDPYTFYIAKCGVRYIGYSHFRKLNDEQLQQGNTAVLKEFWNNGAPCGGKMPVNPLAHFWTFPRCEAGYIYSL
jgi:hypothetical protein